MSAPTIEKLTRDREQLLEALKAMLSKAYKQNWNDAYPEQLEQAQAAIRAAEEEG